MSVSLQKMQSMPRLISLVVMCELTAFKNQGLLGMDLKVIAALFALAGDDRKGI